MKRRRLVGVELEAYLQAVTRALVQTFSPSRVILFGSFARGDQNRASDLDVVVIASTTLPFCERIGQALASCHAASQRLPVEALVYTPAEWQAMLQTGNSFAASIEREGRILYEQEPQPDRSPTLADTGAARS